MQLSIDFSKQYIVLVGHIHENNRKKRTCVFCHGVHKWPTLLHAEVLQRQYQHFLCLSDIWHLLNFSWIVSDHLQLYILSSFYTVPITAHCLYCIKLHSLYNIYCLLVVSMQDILLHYQHIIAAFIQTVNFINCLRLFFYLLFILFIYFYIYCH